MKFIRFDKFLINLDKVLEFSFDDSAMFTTNELVVKLYYIGSADATHWWKFNEENHKDLNQFLCDLEKAGGLSSASFPPAVGKFLLHYVDK